MRRPEVIKEISDVLHQYLPDARLILYGSEARGDAKADSDIDLLVLLPYDKLTISDRRRVSDLLYPLELAYNTVISTVVELQSRWDNRIMTPFKYNIMNEGIVL